MINNLATKDEQQLIPNPWSATNNAVADGDRHWQFSLHLQPAIAAAGKPGIGQLTTSKMGSNINLPQVLLTNEIKLKGIQQQQLAQQAQEALTLLYWLEQEKE